MYIDHPATAANVKTMIPTSSEFVKVKDEPVVEVKVDDIGTFDVDDALLLVTKAVEVTMTVVALC